MSPELKELKDWIKQELLNLDMQCIEQMEDTQSISQLYSKKAIAAGKSAAINSILFKIDEIAARETPAPFKSKGDWVMEIGSGHAGYRCITCLTWVYAEQQKRCSCDGEFQPVKIPTSNE